MDLPFTADLYKTLQTTWPVKGNTILYSPNINIPDETIILYQAYNASIANYAVSNQTFKNCPDFSTTQMTWLKPNFLWMMYRSGWATKTNQERILAITVKKEDFNEILRQSVSTSKREDSVDNRGVKIMIDVRLQWDPDHDPFGEKLERRAIQIGIRGIVLDNFLSKYIMNISDITAFVQEQSNNVSPERLNHLQVPAEQIYIIDDGFLRNHIKLD